MAGKTLTAVALLVPTLAFAAPGKTSTSLVSHATRTHTQWTTVAPASLSDKSPRTSDLITITKSGSFAIEIATEYEYELDVKTVTEYDTKGTEVVTVVYDDCNVMRVRTCRACASNHHNANAALPTMKSRPMPSTTSEKTMKSTEYVIEHMSEQQTEYVVMPTPSRASSKQTPYSEVAMGIWSLSAGKPKPQTEFMTESIRPSDSQQTEYVIGSSVKSSTSGKAQIVDGSPGKQKPGTITRPTVHPGNRFAAFPHFKTKTSSKSSPTSNVHLNMHTLLGSLMPNYIPKSLSTGSAEESVNMASPSEQETKSMTADLEKLSSIKKLLNTAFEVKATATASNPSQETQYSALSPEKLSSTTNSLVTFSEHTVTIVTPHQEQETEYVIASSAMPTDVVFVRPSVRPENRFAGGRQRTSTSVITEKEKVTITQTSAYTAYETIPVHTTETNYVTIPGENETSTWTTVETQYSTLAIPTTKTTIVIEQERVPVTTTIVMPGPNITVTHVSEHTTTVPGPHHTITETWHTTLPGHEMTLTTHDISYITTQKTKFITVPTACPSCPSNTTYIVSTSFYPVTTTATVTPISYITVPPSYITTTHYVTSTISHCSSLPCSTPISWSSWPTQCGGYQISTQSSCSPQWYTSWTTPSNSIWSTTSCETYTVPPTTIPIYPSYGMTGPLLQHRHVANTCGMEQSSIKFRNMTSTIYATSWSTITSCPASQPACTSPAHIVRTSSIPVLTTLCAVSTYFTPPPSPPRTWTSAPQTLQRSSTPPHLNWTSEACSKTISTPKIWTSVASLKSNSPSVSLQTWFRAPSSNFTMKSVPTYSNSSSDIAGTTRVTTTRTTTSITTEYRTRSFIPENCSLSSCTMSTRYSFSYKPNTAETISTHAHTSVPNQTYEGEETTQTVNPSVISSHLSATYQETYPITVAPHESAPSSYQISSTQDSIPAESSPSQNSTLQQTASPSRQSSYFSPEMSNDATIKNVLPMGSCILFGAIFFFFFW